MRWSAAVAGIAVAALFAAPPAHASKVFEEVTLGTDSSVNNALGLNLDMSDLFTLEADWTYLFMDTGPTSTFMLGLDTKFTDAFDIDVQGTFSPRQNGVAEEGILLEPTYSIDETGALSTALYLTLSANHFDVLSSDLSTACQRSGKHCGGNQGGGGRSVTTDFQIDQLGASIGALQSIAAFSVGAHGTYYVYGDKGGNLKLLGRNFISHVGSLLPTFPERYELGATADYTFGGKPKGAFKLRPSVNAAYMLYEAGQGSGVILSAKLTAALHGWELSAGYQVLLDDSIDPATSVSTAQTTQYAILGLAYRWGRVDKKDNTKDSDDSGDDDDDSDESDDDEPAVKAPVPPKR